MKIEKLDIEDIIGRDGMLFLFEKINEIIDFLSLVSENIHALKIENRDKEKRLSDLEQCPANDVTQCRPLISYDYEMREMGLTLMKMIKENYSAENKKEIPKSDYDPDDGKLDNYKSLLPIKSTKYSGAKEGTFEWALIQMKNGKKVMRKSQESYMFVYIDCANKINQYDGKINTCHDNIDWEVILATDWQVISND